MPEFTFKVDANWRNNTECDLTLKGTRYFMANKLGRPNQGVNDKQDVKSVFIRQEGKLDEEYIEKRAKDAECSKY
jgi:hypothetical protein